MSWFLRVDGTELPTPERCPITEYDLDTADTGRTESGYLRRSRVRAGVTSLEETVWEHLTPEQAILIRQALSPVSFTVDFRFPGGILTKQMYAGDRHWTASFPAGKEEWALSVQLTEL